MKNYPMYNNDIRNINVIIVDKQNKNNEYSILNDQNAVSIKVIDTENMVTSSNEYSHSAHTITIYICNFMMSNPFMLQYYGQVTDITSIFQYKSLY
jgi:hypothetical protein